MVASDTIRRRFARDDEDDFETRAADSDGIYLHFIRVSGVPSYVQSCPLFNALFR